MSYVAFEIEKMKLKYITLKEKLNVKNEEAQNYENEFREVDQQLQKVFTSFLIEKT